MLRLERILENATFNEENLTLKAANRSLYILAGVVSRIVRMSGYSINDRGLQRFEQRKRPQSILHDDDNRTTLLDGVTATVHMGTVTKNFISRSIMVIYLIGRVMFNCLLPIMQPVLSFLRPPCVAFSQFMVFKIHPRIELILLHFQKDSDIVVPIGRDAT